MVPNFGPHPRSSTSPAGPTACPAPAASDPHPLGRNRRATVYWGYPGFGLYPGYPWGWGAYGPGYPVSDYPNLNITLR